jgi:ACS family hexuronate transporter-like MFS transporter
VLRWRIAVLVSAAIAISYLDRQTLPVAIKAIERDIPLSNQQFSFLQSAFLLAYAFLYAGGGKLADMLGTRRGFTVVMVAWSVACISHSFALTFTMLAVSRFLLGAGEGGGFPAATRVVAEWFSVKERATAMGIINGGSAVGAVVAPPLISLVLLYANWRWIFILTGLLGLAWTLWWRRAYFPPDEHPRLTAEEFQKLDPAPAITPPQTSWMGLLKFKQTWGIVLAKFMSDAAWYFYLFWLPKYLYDARGFDIKAVGTFAWIPYAAAGIGCLVGGSFSSYLVKRNLSLNAARKIALGLSAALMPSILFVPHVRVSIALAIFSLAYFGQQSWSTLVIVLPTDLFPKNVVGAVAGMVGFGGAIGGILFGQFAGYLLDHGWGYTTVFSLAGTFHVIGFLIILALIPAVRPLTLPTKFEYQAAI